MLKEPGGLPRVPPKPESPPKDDSGSGSAPEPSAEEKLRAAVRDAQLKVRWHGQVPGRLATLSELRLYGMVSLLSLCAIAGGLCSQAA